MNAWDELDNEERATVGPLTRVRLGLPADPNNAPPPKHSWKAMVESFERKGDK